MRTKPVTLKPIPLKTQQALTNTLEEFLQAMVSSQGMLVESEISPFPQNGTMEIKVVIRTKEAHEAFMSWLTIRCPTCKGSGQDRERVDDRCQTCHGTGKRLT